MRNKLRHMFGWVWKTLLLVNRQDIKKALKHQF